MLMSRQKVRNCPNVPFFDFTVRLFGVTTRQAMENHLTSLAEAYSQHPIHRVLLVGYTESWFGFESAALPQELSSDRSTAFEGTLSTYWSNDGSIPSSEYYIRQFDVYGFDAVLWEMDETGSGDSVWGRDYPLNHIEIPTSARRMHP
jgi:hypothetical protein